MNFKDPVSITSKNFEDCYTTRHYPDTFVPWFWSQGDQTIIKLVPSKVVRTQHIPQSSKGKTQWSHGTTVTSSGLVCRGRR